MALTGQVILAKKLPENNVNIDVRASGQEQITPKSHSLHKQLSLFHFGHLM